MNNVPKISRAEYNTILLHTEKISNGQHDFIPVLRRELHDKLNIADGESLIVDLVKNKDVEFLNRVRLFLSQFPFIVESEKGIRYQLVKRGNFCELDFVEETAEPAVVDTPARATEMVVEEVTLETRAERIRRLQADVQRGIIEIGFELIAAKKQIGHGGWADWLNENFSWTQQTANNFMCIAERFGGGKLKNVFQFQPSTLQAMLTLPRGDEQAFIEAQAQAGKPVENQSAREVQAAVKQWKQTKNEEVSQTVEVVDQSQSVGESEGGIIIKGKSAQNSDSSDADLELSSIEEILIVNSSEKDSGVDLKMKRVETQKLLDEISVLIQTAADTKLDETIINLKSIRDVLNATC